MNKIKYIAVLLLVTLNFQFGFAQSETAVGTDLEKSLMELFPKAEIKKMKNLDGYSESYQLILDQPLDHSHPERGTFKHFIYLSHLDFKKPMVIETEGYAARYVKNEVSSLLNANQLIVEYRFYGKSRPNPIPWEYLTNDQAIADYHSIVQKLKQLYSGKWISTGISKGGETTLIYKWKYPKDVDVAMPYVAPLIKTQEDPRTVEHYTSKVGTAECRTKVAQFQRVLLQNRTALLKEIKEHAAKEKMQFTELSIEEALEYGALEFPFSFWQWGANCADIPDSDSTAKELFDYLNKVVGISFYNDEQYYNLLPSYYQHMSELGYYGFDFTPVKDLLQVVKSTSNMRFAPKDVAINYNPKYIKKVRKFVERKGDKILYIYGGNDTWGACAPSPKRRLDALKMVLPGGSHSTRVKDFPKEDQQKIMKTLERWLQ